MMFDGGCECGQIRYRLTSAPIFVNCCHCRVCQKLSGSAFALNAMIESDRMELAGGADVSAVVEEHHGWMRCPACKTQLWAHDDRFGETIRFVRVGTLDEGERVPPDAHFFVRSKHPWIILAQDVRSFETLPTQDDPPLLSGEAAARLKAATG